MLTLTAGETRRPRPLSPDNRKRKYSMIIFGQNYEVNILSLTVFIVAGESRKPKVPGQPDEPDDDNTDDSGNPLPRKIYIISGTLT